MSETINRKVTLRRVPIGLPVAEDFEVVSEPLRSLAAGEMLLRTRWLSLDPYMRSTFMNVAANVGNPIVGGTVSEVLESRAADWMPGDLVLGYYGWQEYSIGTAGDVQWNNPAMPIEKKHLVGDRGVDAQAAEGDAGPGAVVDVRAAAAVAQ